MHTYIWLTLISAIILLILIFSLRNSRRFNLFDHWLHHKLVRKHDGFSWKVISFINDPKLLVILDIFIASFLINEEKELIAFWALFTLGFTDMVGLFLKKWMHRKRPIKHLSLETGYSFPSGHVLGTTIMVLIVWELFKARFGAALVIALMAIWIMVVISRISLKAHYPSDVLGATTLAVFCFGISQQLFLFI